jgi:drug/metabolite transporter (DMT)-like permease
MTFVAPLIAPAFSSVELTVGRYLACGVFSLLLMLWAWLRGDVRRPTLRQAGAALWLSLLGYTGYYLLLVLAIDAAGAALPVLIIGTIPIWIMLLGKPQGLRWAALVPGLLLTVAGLMLMMRETAHAADGATGNPLGLGILYAVLAMATVAGVLVIGRLVGADFDPGRFAAATVVLWLFGCAVAGVTSLVGAMTLSRAIAGGLAAGVLILMYLVNIVAQVQVDLAWLADFGAFKYLLMTELIDTGVVPWASGAIFAVGAVGGWAASLLVFRRRDLLA